MTDDWRLETLLRFVARGGCWWRSGFREYGQRVPTRGWRSGLLSIALVLTGVSQPITGLATPDLFIRDTPSDSGMEPNPDMGAMWISQDIWVRNNPDPAWDPRPYPSAIPAWTPAAHQNPEYRDPRLSVPCYVYVRVTNRGTAPSSSSARLRVFWAKAAMAMQWPLHWSNYVHNLCAPTAPAKLYGQEITKPRKNAANATFDEIVDFVDAINATDTVALSFPGGIPYWDGVTAAHRDAPELSGSTLGHNPAFLPWHREFINRFEILMQEARPKVTLLYWDWVTNPRSTPDAMGVPVNLFGGGFMGMAGTATALTAVGAPFTVTPMPQRSTLAGTPPAAWVAFNGGTPPYPFPTDADILAKTDYGGSAGTGMSATLEERAQAWALRYFGTGSDLSLPARATQDPFYYLIQANGDRVWAMWQREVGHLDRLTPSTAYGADGSHCLIVNALRPWKGTAATPCRTTPDPVLTPWNAAGGQAVAKTPQHASIVSPPFYDTAPLLIPILAPGDSVVLQIPWYPPNRMDFACFGAEVGHFCLLARIEDGTALDENPNVYLHTQANNNVAWKNITVVDDFTGIEAAPSLAGLEAGPAPEGFLARSSVLVRNPFSRPVRTALQFRAPGDAQGSSVLDFGLLTVDLGPDLFRRWIEGGGAGVGVERIGGTRVQLFARETAIEGIQLEPEEAFPVQAWVELRRDYQSPGGRTFVWDFFQLGTPEDPGAVVGGNRFEVDFNEICLVRRGSTWRYFEASSGPGADWIFPGYDDREWRVGKADFGFGDPVTTAIGVDRGTNAPVAAYFRQAFRVADPTRVKRLTLRLTCDDGAVVYLNGQEVYRHNLPEGRVEASTPAILDIFGVAESIAHPRELADFVNLLRAGDNLVAVEVHQAEKSAEPPDLRFDFELCANSTRENETPYVALTGLAEGGQYPFDSPIDIEADVADVDGVIQGVEFRIDGRIVATTDRPPFRYSGSTLPLGWHRLGAVVRDDRGGVAESQADVLVVGNLLPSVVLTAPVESRFRQGTAVELRATAEDGDGAVASVEFFARAFAEFGAVPRSVGRSASPPYVAVVKDLAPGPHLLTAVAMDDRGEYSQAAPIVIEVGSLGLAVNYEGGEIVVTWDDPEGTLEMAPEVGGPWADVVGAVSPFRTAPDAGREFYRLRFPER